jgi:hypothetical protein
MVLGPEAFRFIDRFAIYYDFSLTRNKSTTTNEISSPKRNDGSDQIALKGLTSLACLLRTNGFELRNIEKFCSPLS